MQTILVVDDHRDIADSVALLLQIHGCDVRVAYDAARAFDSIVDRRPDVVVVDLGMPNVNGYELARQIQALPGPAVRLVAHTAWNDDETRKRVAEAGFDVHLAKPATLIALLSAIGYREPPGKT